MWGDWVERAKSVAANIDKQINESVGIDDDGGLASPADQAEEENVWNDDFDQAFGDDASNEEEQTSIPSQPVPEQPLPSAETHAVDSLPDTKTPDSPSDKQDSNSELPSGSNASNAVGITSPDMVNEGWGNEDDDVLDTSENQDEVVDFQGATPAHSDPADTKSNALETASSMISSFSSSAAPMSSFLSSTAAVAASAGSMSSLLHSTVGVLDKVAKTSSQEEHPLPENESTPDVPKPVVTPQSVDQLEQDDSGVVEPTVVQNGEGWEGDTIIVDEVAGEAKAKVGGKDKPLEQVPSEDEAKVEKPVEGSVETATETAVASEPNADHVEPRAESPREDTPTSDSQGSATAAVQPQAPVDIEEDPRYKTLVEQLRLRENQLSSKSEQLAELQGLWETQEQELRQKIQETKDEAKKRIQKAKERCEAAEAKLKQQTSSTAESGAQQDQLIAALRQEGENLARKQSEMEKAVRSAKAESRGLAEQLEGEIAAKEQALEKVAKLEAELKQTKESLVSARKGESQAGKLENDLLAARSDAELKAASILSLEQQIKELKAESKELKDGLASTRKGAEEIAERESKKLRREHNDAIADLEMKLRTSEREAGVREDALRHEVSELRKRWEDAVRRADALSMDVQSSTAPLLRQLESMERQNRARASAWAELENKLRSELEETVIQNEKLSKERSEFKTKFTRLDRIAHERDAELKECRSTIDMQTAKLTKLEAEIADKENDAKKLREDYEKVERLANEGVSRVRSEMTQTVVDSEERYRGQIEKLEGELRVEREKRNQLENQVADLLDNAGMIITPQAPQSMVRESKPKKLRGAEGQAEILAGALGFESDDDDDFDEANDSRDRDAGGDAPKSGMSSFAALEQLSSRLKIATVELEALRANLRESEKTRDSLVAELAESRLAKEKLPLFEAKVKELTEDNREKELEIQGLRYDIAEVRDLYRAQLNVLLEEKASSFSSSGMNGGSIPFNDTGSKQPEQTIEPPYPDQSETLVPGVEDDADTEEGEQN